MKKAEFKFQVIDFGIGHLTRIMPDNLPVNLKQFNYSIACFKGMLYLVLVHVKSSSQHLTLYVLRRPSFDDNWSTVAQQQIDLTEDLELSFEQINSQTNNISPSSAKFDSVIVQLATPTLNQARTLDRLYLGITVCDRIYLFSSTDGEHFHPILMPANIQRCLQLSDRSDFMGVMDHHLCWFGAQLQADRWCNQIWIWPLSSLDEPLLETEDSAIAISLPIDDPTRQAFKITQVQICDRAVYIALSHEQYGFQLWRLAQDAQDVWQWQTVLEKGAYSYSLGANVYSMTEFQADLYLLSGTAKPYTYGTKPWYAKQFEILKVYPDQDWDIVAGVPRFTPLGLKVPLSGSSANFDTLENTTFQQLAVHRDLLCVVVFSEEGLRIWISNDGEIWRLIPNLSIQDYYCVDVHRILSTPFGVVLMANVIDFEQHRQVGIWLAH